MKILDDLKRTEREVLYYFSLNDTELQKKYGPNKWNIKQILHHIADAESVLYDRIRRAISKPGQIVWGFDQDAWCDGLDYNNMPLQISLDQFVSIRKAVYHLAEQFYLSHGANFYIHNETGNRTLKEEFDKVVWHADHHMIHINKALNKNNDNPQN
tara:strand:+ start:4612 stop:5079 length:468 start_codon:yes stop_codon:yes gene_type:complete